MLIMHIYKLKLMLVYRLGMVRCSFGFHKCGVSMSSSGVGYYQSATNIKDLGKEKLSMGPEFTWLKITESLPTV